MGRLIDADALERIIKMEHCMVINGHLAIRKPNGIYRPLLGEMPTVCDVEKVVAELEEMIKPKRFYFCKYAKGGCKHIDNDEKDCMECIIEMAIDIVKRGGVE